MKAIAKKSILSGHITVPGSKSHTIRALILASMAEGTSHISNPLPSNDCLSTVKAVKQVGAEVLMDGDVWTVHGAGRNLHLPEAGQAGGDLSAASVSGAKGGLIDVGNSGSLMYFLCPVLSTLPGDCTFTGDESICRRPVNHLVDALSQLGAQGKCLNGGDTPPFSFCGPIDLERDLVTGGELSQYISGFMMAASRLNGTLHMKLTNPKETPYLTMTRIWLESLGVPVEISPDFRDVKVKGPVQIQAFDRAVPSDWEGVAFPLIAALVSGSSIVIDNIDGSGSQGDDKIVEVLQSVGADIVWDKKAQTLAVNSGAGRGAGSGLGHAAGAGAELGRSGLLTTKNLPGGQLTVEMSAFPDAICALAVMACFIEGKTVFTDIDICRKKETDRIKAMVSELSKLGAHLEDQGDRLVVYGDGGRSLHGGAVESYKDHRIVMSLACLGLGLAEGESVEVSDAEWCSVTFPHFFEVMNKIGAGFVVSE
ncbi:MAG: 3-phosphoshikimate 1-carboxyvinyltransferase [Treponema sp.]|nr:3-phosphoshikimate 1-carboxyvinyltransferase [Treponema sp.]